MEGAGADVLSAGVDHCVVVRLTPVLGKHTTANSAHIAQSRLEFGLGFQAYVSVKISTTS